MRVADGSPPGTRSLASRVVQVALAALVAVASGLTLLSSFGDGLSIRVAGMRVSVRAPARPFLLAVIAFALLTTTAPALRRTLQHVAARMRRDPSRLAWALTLLCAAAILVIGVRYGAFIAAGSDSFGYVVQAEALAGRRSLQPDPLAASAPWPDALWSLTPHGYIALADGRVAPAYPPGFPLLMAAFAAVGGERAMCLVLPLAGVATILATFLVGQQLGGNGVGSSAALLMFTSPVLLFHASVPMSDLPAAAFWTCALAAVLSATPVGATIGGLLSGAALLVRPSLAPLALALAGMAVFANPDEPHPTRARRRSALFFAGMLPGVAALLAFNAVRYGLPWQSGYGSWSALFGADYLGVNLLQFARWSMEMHTIFVFLGLLTVIPFVRRAAGETATARRQIVLLLLYVLAVWVCSAFYTPFDNWTFLRFLLPAFPALFVLAAAVTLAACRRLNEPYRLLAAVGIISFVALTMWQRLGIEGIVDNARSLRRFADVPRFAATTFPESTVYMTRIYSGSMRYYGNRRTLRWDVLDPAWLDRAIDDLMRRGLPVLIVVDAADEEALFRTRFGGKSEWGRLDWPPAAEYRGPDVVRIFDPRDRSRARNGEPVKTRTIAVR